jgi:hypothetical protein
VFHWKKFWKSIEWKLYGPLLEIDGFIIIHNNSILPCYGYRMGMVWIYYGFSGAIANVIVWISLFFPVFVSSISCYFIPVILSVKSWMLNTRVRISQLAQQDVFALLVPSCRQVWNKLVSSCGKDDEANIPSARNKLLTCTSWLLRADCISLVGTTCSKSVIIINLVTRW